MDAKIDSMMEHLDKRIDDKVDSKLGPVMDRFDSTGENKHKQHKQRTFLIV